jgi:hypothetical protein
MRMTRITVVMIGRRYSGGITGGAAWQRETMA